MPRIIDVALVHEVEIDDKNVKFCSPKCEWLWEAENFCTLFEIPSLKKKDKKFIRCKDCRKSEKTFEDLVETTTA